jgi:hypothetical protein
MVRGVRWFLLLGAGVLALAVGVVAQERPDELRLRDGTVVLGKVVEVDRNTVVFRTEAGLREYRRAEVRAIFFDGMPADSPGETTPGYTAVPPLKVQRVITLRHITNNRIADEGRFEPEIAKISGDGSRIAFWAPKTGLYTINHDGTDQRLAAPLGPELDRPDGQFMEVSPDGKYVYLQNGQSAPVFRINGDGSGKILLARTGSEYEPLRLRQGGKRLYIGSRGFIASFDTEGKGDYREILNQDKISPLIDVPNNGDGRTHFTAFDVSEDGARIVANVFIPREQKRQLCAFNGDGSGFRVLLRTEFEPGVPQFTPDGRQVLFNNRDNNLHIVNWDGTGLRELPIPYYGSNSGPAQRYRRFSPDGQWLAYQAANDGPAGDIITRLDGSERYEPYIRWIGFDNREEVVFSGSGVASYSTDLKRFVYVRRHGRRQLVVGDINPRSSMGVPVVSDIDFSGSLSTNPQVPANVGHAKARVKPGTGDVLRVVYAFNPMITPWPTHPAKWNWGGGWVSLTGTHIMADDGKNGDAAAGDGLFTNTAVNPHPTDYKPPAGRRSMRIIAHDERNAVMVDVDGVEIRN